MPFDTQAVATRAFWSWYLVPWGAPAGAPMRLCTSLRMMLDETALHASPVLDDWPAALDAMQDATFTMESAAGAGNAAVRPGEAYRAYLRSVGMDLGQASALWRAIFGDLAAALPGPGVAAVAARRAPRPKRVRSHSTDALVRHANRHIEALYGEPVDEALRARGAKGAAAGALLLVRPVAPGPALRKDLREIAAMYALPGTPARSLASHIAQVRERQKASAGTSAQDQAGDIDRWSEHMLGVLAGQGIGVAAADGAKATLAYSHTHIDFLLRRGGLAPADGHQVSGADTDRMNPFATNLASRRRMYANAGGDDARQAIAEARPPAREFCARLTALAVHPWLCRVLGIVVGIEVASPVPVGQLRRIAIGRPGGAVGAASSPGTMLKDGFPAPYHAAGKDYRGGLLDLAPGAGKFTLTQFDADRSPDHLLQAALVFRSQETAGVESGSATVEMQGEETVGFSVIETGMARKDALHDRPDRSTTPDLYLEHLLTGYRPDVKDMSDPRHGWQALGARRIRRVLLKDRDITAWFARVGRCEAMQAERTRVTRPNDEREDQVEDELFRWTLHNTPDGGGGQEFGVLHVTDVGSTSNHGLVIDYQPVDVPEQRVGHAYRFGVRLAMIDGSSIDLPRARALYDAPSSTPPTLGGQVEAGVQQGEVCQRFEPVAPPTALLAGAPVRERFPKDGSQHVVLASVKGPFGDRDCAERVLVPPRAGIDQCLRLGALDAYRGAPSWPDSAFPDTELDQKGDFPTVTSTWSDRDGQTRSARDPVYRRRPLAWPAPARPYYPDPWATTVVVALFRKGDEHLMAMHEFDYYGGGRRWPDCRPLRLKLQTAQQVTDQDAGFDVLARDDELVVTVAPGAELVLRAWHRLDAGRFVRMNQLTRIAGFAASPGKGAGIQSALGPRGLLPPGPALRQQVAELLAGAGAGLALRAGAGFVPSYWMFNPFEEITAVHAIERPLAAAAPDPGAPLAIARAPGATSGPSTGRVLLDRRSTARVSAEASWADIGPAALRHGDKGYRRPVAWRNGELFNIPAIAIVAADDTGTPARAPMGRRREPFQHYQDVAARLAASATVLGTTRRATGEFDFGDTRARIIDIVTSAESRHGDEFWRAPEPGNRRKSRPQPSIVVATASPPPPEIDDILPLIASEDQTSLSDDLMRVRQDGWFRIWLKSWYASGNGELLALACLPGAPPPTRMASARSLLGLAARGKQPTSALDSLVTQWGLDPAAGQEIAFDKLPMAALRNRLASPADLLASGGPAEVLDIDLRHLAAMTDFTPRVHLRQVEAHRKLDFGAGDDADLVELGLYRPLLDRSSGNMYVDVRIDPAYAYQPFVRLALARYQHHAWRDTERDLRLSAIVATEFVQLMPGRIATLTSERNPRGKVTGVRIAVHGTTIPRGGRAALKTLLFATIEERILNLAEPLEDGVNGAWIPVPGSGENHALAPDVSGQRWGATIPLSTRVAREYSVRIEEYETAAHETSEGRRLVFFDRLPLTRI